MLLIVAVVSAGLLLMAGCGKQDAGAGMSKKPPLVKVVPARKETLTDWLEVTGDVVATNAVTISATVEGPIAFCPWREGDTVEKGGRLVQIDRPIYREDVQAMDAALAVAQARLADLKAGARPEEIAQATEAVTQLENCTGFAESDMKRIEQMVTSGSLPGEALEKARVAYVKCRTQLVAAQEKLQMLKAGPTVTAIAVQEALVKEAAARLEKAKATLAECTVSAPFASVITRVYVRPGDLATAKAPLLDLMEKNSLVVRVGIPESSSAAVREGAAVKVTFDALPGREFEASVSRIYPDLDPKTRTRLIEVSVAPDIGVAPGMFARAAVAVQTVKDAVIVPDSAVLTTPQGGRIAFVVNDGKAALRRVKTGLEASGRLQIVEGIQAGEQVIVAGHEMLKDGAPVRLPAGAAKPEQPSADKR
jgi:multidrug efflux pump subunit AcrA (membrane-fusion protein)